MRLKLFLNRRYDIRMESDPVENLTLPGHLDSITGLALSPDENFLLSNAMDSTLRLWDIRPFVADSFGREAVGIGRCTRGFDGTLPSCFLFRIWMRLPFSIHGHFIAYILKSFFLIYFFNTWTILTHTYKTMFSQMIEKVCIMELKRTCCGAPGLRTKKRSRADQRIGTCSCNDSYYAWF